MAQERQKLTYNQSAKECTVKVGQRVMVHMPSELQGNLQDRITALFVF